MSETPLITTILPTFRRPERLKKAIESALSQTYPHFHLCIYDNASGDETAAVVERYAKSDPRVHYHCHLENIGAAENFQFGLERVRTPFFSFLADDDYLLPTFYETTLEGFKKHSDVAFVLTAVVDKDEQGRVIDIILSRWPDQEYYPAPEGLLQMIGNDSNWTGALFRKEAAEKIGPLDSKLKAIDVDYLFRMAAVFPFSICKKPGAVFEQHSSSYSGVYGFKVIWPGWQKMSEKFAEHSQLPQKIKKTIGQKLRVDLSQRLFRHSLRCLEKRDFEEAQKSINVLKNHGEISSRLFFLEKLLKLCKMVPLAQKTLTSALQLRRYLKRNDYHHYSHL